MESTLEQLNTALVGRYQVERELGRFGMATVYLARDLRLDRMVAIKVFSGAHASVSVRRGLGWLHFYARDSHQARVERRGWIVYMKVDPLWDPFLTTRATSRC